MKSRRWFSAATALALLGAAGCATERNSAPAKTQPPAHAAPVVQAVPVAVAETPRPPPPPPAPPPPASAPEPAPAPTAEAQELPAQIPFDYDAYQIKEPYRPVLQAHAKKLIADPSLRLVIQARVDPRGPRDYNRALANKRAEMVKKQLVSFGVAPDRLRTAVGRPAAKHGSIVARRVELIYR